MTITDNDSESLITIIPVYYFLLDTLNVQCWLILFILNTCKQVLWQAVNTQTAFISVCTVKKNQQSPGTNIHKFKDCQPL